MKIAKKLKILITLIIFMTIILGMVTNVNYAMYEGKSGPKRELDIYTTEANWVDEYIIENRSDAGYKMADGVGGTYNYYWKGNYGGRPVWGFDLGTLRQYNNVFCAEKGEYKECPVGWYDLVWRVDIQGERAYFYSYDEDGTTEELIGFSDDELNNKMAFITSHVPTFLRRM